MSQIRLIARLDVKAPNLIKGVHLEGLRKIGEPNYYAKRYYDSGIDEIIYIDAVASLYERNSLLDIVARTSKDVFVPITVGGGLRTIDDIGQALRAGADKVAINTAAVRHPEFLREAAEVFGSQCIVLSVAAQRQPNGWEALTDGGRERSGLDALVWIKQCAELGVGEVLITSIDREGTRKGYDIDLVSRVNKLINVPVIASGGMGAPSHLIELTKEASPSAAAIADFLHYDRLPLAELRERLREANISVREPYL